MSRNHDHEADEHYHGEPSRVLDDTPFPESVVLYPGTPETGLFNVDSSVRDRDVTYWSDVLQSIPSVHRMAVNQTLEGDDSFVDSVLTFNPDQPGGFLTDELLDQPSLLFIPGRLRMDEDAWEDLRKNDVTVNWISLDPDESGRKLSRAVVLSDWIVTVDEEIPRSRSAGTTTGIFHLKDEQLENFLIALNDTDTPWDAFDQLLSEPDIKIRPAFIRNRDWSFEE